jgi:hypothetical protein
LRALPAHWQAATMTHAAVSSQIHQSLDIHGDFTSQIAFHAKVRDRVAKPCNLGLAQVLNLHTWLNRRSFTGFERTGAADSMYVRQRDHNVLVDGNVNSGDSRHSPYPLRGLTLSLFVSRI